MRPILLSSVRRRAIRSIARHFVLGVFSLVAIFAAFVALDILAQFLSLLNK